MSDLLSLAILLLVVYVLVEIRKLRLPIQNNDHVVLDSCALIDGRIESVIDGGYITGNIIVPAFILSELQMLADGSDNQKRSRARHGLEVSNSLRQKFGKRFILDEFQAKSTTTDDRLIELAKKRNARLCTTDYNLNKVAASHGLTVLNVNELAQAMRTSLLPGEEVEVKILQKGESKNQGVGYLEDGSMVVIDQASKLIGTKQTIVIERSLQTVAGKMSFAHLKSKKLRS